MNVVRPPRQQVTEVVKHTGVGPIAEARLPAARTGPMAKVLATMQDLGFGKILGAGDAFRNIGKVLSWSRHGKALLGQALPAQNLQHLPDGVTASFPVTVL